MKKRALALLLLALVPIAPFIPFGQVFVGDPESELPVKLWGALTFPRIGFFGGIVDSIGFPHPGPLNNPDLLLSAWFSAFSGLFGNAWAWNGFLGAQLFATMWGVAALAKEVCEDEEASWTAAAAVGLAPMVLVYCVAGAVSDMLSLWPYPLAARALLRAVRGDTPGRDAAMAGAWAGLGFVTCPYDTLTFLIWLPMLVLALPVLWREAADAEGTEYALRRVGIVAAGVVGVGGLVAGAYAAQLHAIMADTQSQMSDALVQSTRHAPPFPFLQPLHTSRYVAVLADYVAVGKRALIAREAGSRYFRAYSPGLFVIGLALLGLVRGRARGASLFWLGAALLAVLASMGPFLSVDGHPFLDTPDNPVYLLAYDFLGGKMLLEPFRYAVPASVALGVAASLGVAILPRWLRMLLPAAIAAEVVLVSPVPIPLPGTRMTVPSAYLKLDSLLPAGPILDLPYFDRGSGRFNRTQFYFQLVHRRPIPNEVSGFVPKYLQNNAFTAALINGEGVYSPLAVAAPDPARIEADRAAFVADGFAGVVVDPGAYRDAHTFEGVRTLLEGFGDPVYTGDRTVWRCRPKE